MQRFGKCHLINYRLCAYIRKPKKDRFYTCIFIEKGFRKALRTDNFKKKAVFVCTFRADKGKNDQNAHIKSMKKPFSYVRACLRSFYRTGQPPAIPRELNERSHHRLRLRMVSPCLTETSAQTGWVRTCPILRVNVPQKTRNVPPRLRNL